MYTNKDTVRCFIATSEFRVEGDMHVLSGSRLTDALNSKAKDFLVVTNASVYDLKTGKLLYEPGYLTVNREMISIIFPID